jgi:hypothetical protein
VPVLVWRAPALQSGSFSWLTYEVQIFVLPRVSAWQAYFFEIAAKHAPWQVASAANVMWVTDPAQK